MKRLLFILSLVIVLGSLIGVSSLYSQQARIAVISDLHYMHPSLIVEDGEALENYLRRDRKLLRESDAILRRTVQYLLNENVNLVLIPGDVTKDGEKISHNAVAELLKPLRDKGVKILIVPGNHDINNPEAVSFHGDHTQPEETVSASEFERIYADYGFGDAISRDENSLSYVCEPVTGLRVLCIDACKYYDNTFKSRGARKDSCVTNGRIKPQTMLWIEREMHKANSAGKQIIAIMHHNVVEHFEYESLFAAPYLVDDYQDVQHKFLNYGLNMVFTGHFHSSDVARVDDKNGNYLYDIETGSIVTYPCPYRVIDIVADALSMQTKYVEDIDYALPEGITFQQHAKDQIKKGFNEMVPQIISEYYHNLSKFIPRWVSPFVKLPDAERLSQLLLDHFSAEGVNMLIAHYHGNETEQAQAKINKRNLLTSIDEFIDAVSKESGGMFAGITKTLIHRMDIVKKAKAASESIWDDMMIADANDGSEIIYAKQPVNDLQLVFRFKSTINNKPEDPVLLSASSLITNETNRVGYVPFSDNGNATVLVNRFATIGRKKKYILE